MRLRRRIRELEDRIAALERPAVDYGMPPPVDINMDPRQPLREFSLDIGYYQAPPDEEWSPGVYI